MVVPNNHGVFLLKMIILGCFGGTTIYGNTHLDPKNIPSKTPKNLRRYDWKTWIGFQKSLVSILFGYSTAES